MTSIHDTHPVGERGKVAGRRGTVVGSTTILSEGLGVPAAPFTLLVVRLDTGQGGYLSGPGRGISQNVLPQSGSDFSTYVSCLLVAPDCWTPDELPETLSEIFRNQYPDGTYELEV